MSLTENWKREKLLNSEGHVGEEGRGQVTGVKVESFTSQILGNLDSWLFLQHSGISTLNVHCWLEDEALRERTCLLFTTPVEKNRWHGRLEQSKPCPEKAHAIAKGQQVQLSIKSPRLFLVSKVWQELIPLLLFYGCFVIAFVCRCPYLWSV